MPRRAASKPKPASQARRSAAPLTLPATCTLREAGELQQQLLKARPGVQGITLDGGDVRRIDTAGLQLLAALALREAEAGRPLQWQNISDDLRAAGTRAGLATALGFARGAA
jgi:anti-anti-sigma regulatory factor